jgi:hypothetical protein
MAGDGKKVETRTVTYLAPGVAPDLTPGTPSLDPELEKVRDREAKALADVKVDTAFAEPTLDPALAKARDAEIKRDRDRAGVSSSGTATASAEPAKKAAPAKKTAKK